MYNPEQYRHLYPYLNTGRIWFNHAATSPLSTRVTGALDRLIQAKSEGTIDDFSDFLKTYVHTKQLVGTLLHCEPERIAFADNTSNGLNILASGLDWKPGDRIILNTIEFPANVYPFLNLAGRGVEIDFVQERNGRILTDDIRKVITPKTRLLSISFVQFLTGFRANLEELGSLCTQHNIIFCVDAIQGLGALPIDVVHSHIDFLSSGTQKWLMGLQELAFVYVTEALQHRITQSYLGWTSHENFFGDFLLYRMHLDPSARRYENGSLNVFGIHALRESLSTLLDVGIEQIYGHLIDLTQNLIDGMQESGFSSRTPTEKDCRSGIVSFNTPNAQGICRELQKRNIIVSPREGVIRVAPHYYNTLSEVEKFLIEVKKIGPATS
jgi:selenocysteine lyase/cysteine desulfurase